ncbi:MAG: MBL fold metallo-hydrolase [Clostridiales bacterium]|jgi:metallo-beta-lactamase family protein|nr:MBL fold metallo-hydrolase [Eubacteriales bacterium]MDH7565063.1 MBL fold metallo-hydrolase [Clostridiales bacterium]
MKITFLGAAKTVTGSCYLIETQNRKFLVDCGMYQGHAKEDALNEEPFPFDPAGLDFILLTHAHIDHSGRIPKIYLDGFKGEIIATKATVELCGIMLPDCGHIQEMETEWTNRKRLRAGKSPVNPLYTFQDAVDCLKLFRSVRYGEIVRLNENIRVKFNDAGHILGSAIIEVWVRENNEETKIVFSGDLGNKDIPILRDPSIIESTDYLVVESTYGNRLHKMNENKVERFLNIINETVDKGGNVIIPSFAVGRTQEIIYDLHKREKMYSEKLKNIMNIPVFVDSPLAISATEIFRNNLDCYDEEARAYIENGDNPLDFPGLQFTKTPDESKALNERKDSVIIISASGMCEAGRIKHHLKHNLWREESTILFVGYQAPGTLGRNLVDGAKKVRLFGEEITVNARIEMIDGFSGHADKQGLMEWIGKFKKKPQKIFIVHGEEEVMEEFSGLVNEQFHVETIIPSRGESYQIKAGSIVGQIEAPADVVQKYKRLALVELMETLKEELEELSEQIKADLKQEKEDAEIDTLGAKLKGLEKQMVEILK